MGLRNPFRIEFNQETGELYIADYSPDANAPNPLRGPAGQGKWTVVTEAANFGWPYCATAELPYVDYDFATGRLRRGVQLREPGQRVAEQHRASTELPPVTQPDVWYSYTLVRRVPGARDRRHRPDGRARRTSSTPRSAKGKNSTAWPEYYDDVPLFYEWTRDYIKAFFTEGGDVTRIEDVRRARSTSTTRSTSSSGRTGRCTCSTTATASSARTCRAPSSCGSTSSAPSGNRTPTRDGRRPTRRGLRAADRALHEHGRATRRAAAAATRGTSTPTATSTRAQPNPTSHVHRGRACTAPRCR